MMSVSFKKVGGNGEYYIQAATADDYYSNDAAVKEDPGRYFNFGGDIPGVTSNEIVNANDFRALMGGFDPTTGVGLVQGAGKQNHVQGYDFTFSTPKDVSVLWSQASQEHRQLIEDCMREANHRAVQFMSDHAAETRRGKDGVIKEKVGLVGVTWPHGSSRENDPQLHDHNVFFNLCQRADGSHGTIDVANMLRWQGAAAGIFHAELAYRLQEKLGIDCEVKENEVIFSVKDFPNNVREAFSKRRQQIKEEAKKAGKDIHDVERGLVQKWVNETRQAKSELTRTELRERWMEEGKQMGFTQKETEMFFKRYVSRPPSTEEFQKIVDGSPILLTKSNSTFSEPNLYSILAIQLQAKGVPADQIEQAVQDLITSGKLISLDQAEKLSNKELLEKPYLIKLGIDRNGNTVYTTGEMRAVERQMMEDSKTINVAHIQSKENVDQVIADKKGISEEQTAAVRYACRDTHMVSVVEGSPGAGKTFMVEAIKNAYETNGYELHGVALSWSASGVLSSEAKIEHTRAIEGFVRDVQQGKIELGPKSLILIDEAGLVGSRHMSTIFAAAKKSGAKVILTGDTKQLAPVDAGGAMEAIVEEIGSARIDTIRRQKEVWQREAVLDFINGRAADGLLKYYAHDEIKLCENGDSAIKQMVADWKEYRKENEGKTALLIANDNESVRLLNGAVRHELKKKGEIVGEEITIRTTDLRKGLDAEFAVGDQIMFRQNDKARGIFGDPTRKDALGVYNRTRGTITAIHMVNGAPEIEIALDKGGMTRIRCAADGQGAYWDKKTKAVPIQHAFSTTVYASQGMTEDRSFILDSGRFDRRLAGVGMSRHRDACTVYADTEDLYSRIMSRKGPDEWEPMSKISDIDLIDQMRKTWSRATEKATTIQWVKEHIQNAGKARKTEPNQDVEKTFQRAIAETKAKIIDIGKVAEKLRQVVENVKERIQKIGINQRIRVLAEHEQRKPARLAVRK